MRFDVLNFGSEERRTPPEPVTGDSALRWGEERVRWLREEGTPAQNDPVRKSGIKRVSCMYRLPYWRVSPPTIMLSVMSYMVRKY